MGNSFCQKYVQCGYLVREVVITVVGEVLK